MALCIMCEGTCVYPLRPDYGTPEHPRGERVVWVSCPACNGTGLEPV